MGGLAGHLFGSVASKTAANVAEQQGQMSAAQAAEREKQALARKEHLTQIFLAKGCSASDPSAPGKTPNATTPVPAPTQAASASPPSAADASAETLAEVLETSDTIWEECDVDDYEEAFTHHPKIGDVESLSKKYENTKTWAVGEQKGVENADRAVIEKLAEGNKTYEEKFGHIFIVCATGKSAAEMLSMLEGRMKNDPKDEILIAAGEQNKITRLRLKKLLA